MLPADRSATALSWNLRRHCAVDEAMTRLNVQRRRVGILLSLILLSTTACGARSVSDALPTSPTVQPAMLGRLPRHLREVCLQIEVLAPRCPADLPATESRYHVRELDYGTDAYRVVDFEANAPYPGISLNNAPPRFAHVVLKGGDLTKAFYFEWPSETTVPITDALNADRQAPLLLEPQPWSRPEGSLALAPRVPAGGVDGDHLVYRWEEGKREYAMSLHAWMPLGECVATLGVLIASIM